MIIVDVNVLIYAFNADAPQHERAREWLERALSGSEVIGVPWAVIHGFLRITTNTRIGLPMNEALAIVNEWFRSAAVTLVEPGARYWSILQGFLVDGRNDRELVSDAHLAALAIENNASVCSTDRDFDRFTGLPIINPLA